MAEGFRLVVRNPAILLAELAWRWAFGAAALVLIAVSVYEVERAVTITPADELLLASLQPMLMAEAWAHILRQTYPLLARVSAVLLPCLTAMWIAAATIGRGLTTRRMVERLATERQAGGEVGRVRWGALVALHAFRAAVGLAVALGYIGSALLASRFVKTDEATGVPNVQVALMVFLFVFALVLIVAAAINWVLVLAPVFAVRDGRRTWDSLREALRMFRTRGSEFTSTATMNGFLRFVAACAATVLGLFPFTMVGVVPVAVVWAGVVLVTLAYFLVSDWLLLARLAAYLVIVDRAAEKSELVVNGTATDPCATT